MEEQIEQLLGLLTLEEKIGMIHGAGLFRTAGVERLDIPPLRFSDGPMGVRGEYPDDRWEYIEDGSDLVTYLPCGSALASTWNRELVRQVGTVLGEEARGRGKDVILAPGINIKRHPLCGRNFEYMSEDPYLTGELAVQMVQGIQSRDVAACVKHFAANNQETDRLWVDTRVDRRTLEEIYFPAFRAAVEKGGVFALMGAYNRLNGEHCCTSRQLLDGVLRKQWGYDGLIVSDWGGVHDTGLAAESALDVEMDVTYDFDGHYLAKPLLEKIRAGELSERSVDRKVRNILRLMLRLKMIGPGKESRKTGGYNTPEHQKVALEAARESVILLKNENKRLPLDSGKIRSLAVIGGNAVATHAFGGGSSEIKALYEITPLMGIKKHLGGNVTVCYAPGYAEPQLGGRPEISWQATSTQAGQLRPQEPVATPEQIARAVAVAKECDAVIFVGGLNHDYDTEGLDRQDMVLPYGQDRLIEALLEARPDTVVALMAGSPVEMPWLDRAGAVVWSYYAGMEGGTALAEVLFGAVDPSGRLAETMLKTAGQCPLTAREGSVAYTEGVMVGYRHYNRQQTAVQFPFGHGLSYTEFAYENLSVIGREVSLTVKNVGHRPGQEVVQLYISGPEMQQLRGFEKVFLQPGEGKTVTFLLTKEDFSAFDTEKETFLPVAGTYEIQLGASSRDIRLRHEVEIPAFLG